MSPRPGRPRRTISRDAVRRQLLVFVEGRKTEERYLVDWHRRYRAQVIITVDPFRGGPLQLVEHAVASMRQEAQQERRGRDRAHDEIWCMFDIDEHANVPEAISLARAHGVGVAISNPCLELWFVLHFEDQTAWIGRNAAQDRSEQLLGCDKVLTDAALRALFDHFDDAMRRARHLDEKHAADGSPEGENPSSGVWQLVEAIRRA